VPTTWALLQGDAATPVPVFPSRKGSPAKKPVQRRYKIVRFVAQFVRVDPLAQEQA
jgi:hypothetical protein